MKKLFVLVLLMLIAGCSRKPEVVTLKSGLQYADDTVGTGRQAKLGDLVTVNFSAWIIKDSKDLFSDWNKDSSKINTLIGTTKYRSVPVKFILSPNAFIKGSEEGIAGMKAGGTRTIVIPSELAYGKRGIGPIPPNTNIKVQVQLVSAKLPANAQEWAIDSTQIKTTKDGLKYEILKAGTGPNAADGNIVTVNYSGYFMNGKKFDSSVDRDQPIQFKVGMHSVIPGWEEGIKLLNKGAKARFIIPPSLGYGDKQNGIIPPNSTLIFDVEVLDIK